MSSAFFWLAIFPLLVGVVIFAIIILILRGGKKPAASGTNETKSGEYIEKLNVQRITPARFVKEVAHHSHIDEEEAERIIEFVFSYFPAFNWRSNLPRVRDGNMHEDDQE